MLSRVRLFVTPWTAARQAPLNMEFSTQDYWSGFPLPTPGGLPDPGIKVTSPVSPGLVDGLFTTETLGKPPKVLAAQLCLTLGYPIVH